VRDFDEIAGHGGASFVEFRVRTGLFVHRVGPSERRSER